MDDSAIQQLLNYVSEASHGRELSDWLWGLGAFGREVLCRAALAVAAPCLDIWQRGVPEEEGWRRFSSSTEIARSAFEAATRCLDTGSDRRAVATRLTEFRELVELAQHYADEASGSAEHCARMNRSVAAGNSIVAALEAVSWDADRATAGVSDEAERRAIVAAGPALESWHAVRGFLFARSAAPDEARQLITLAFLERQG